MSKVHNNNNQAIETKYPHPSNIHEMINNGEVLVVELRAKQIFLFLQDSNSKIRCKYSLCEHIL